MQSGFVSVVDVEAQSIAFGEQPDHAAFVRDVPSTSLIVRIQYLRMPQNRRRNFYRRFPLRCSRHRYWRQATRLPTKAPRDVRPS